MMQAPSDEKLRIQIINRTLQDEEDIREAYIQDASNKTLFKAFFITLILLIITYAI